MKRTFVHFTGARTASALLAFTLGATTHSLLSQYRTPPSSPPPVNVVQSTINEPAAVPLDTAAPVPTPEIVFGGGLKLVSNQVQLTNEFLRYEVNLTYPQIEGSDALRIRNLNQHIETLATTQSQWLLNPSKENLRYYKKGLHPEAFNSVSLDYKVVLATDSFLSIYFEAFSYGIGAAHSVQYSFVVNYDFKSNRLVRLSDIFKPGSKYLEVISKFCIEELSRTEDGGSLWTKELAPVARNFESWNLTHDGIRFNFDACKLFGCASGKQSVEIPFTDLKNIQRKHGN